MWCAEAEASPLELSPRDRGDFQTLKASIAEKQPVATHGQRCSHHRFTAEVLICWWPQKGSSTVVVYHQTTDVCQQWAWVNTNPQRMAGWTSPRGFCSRDANSWGFWRAYIQLIHSMVLYMDGYTDLQWCANEPWSSSIIQSRHEARVIIVRHNKR